MGYQPAVIVYRQPAKGQTDGIVVYEAPEIRRMNTVVAGFVDGRAEVMTTKDFDAAMK